MFREETTMNRADEAKLHAQLRERLDVMTGKLHDCERCNRPSPLVTTDVEDADGCHPQLCVLCVPVVQAEAEQAAEERAYAQAECHAAERVAGRWAR